MKKIRIVYDYSKLLEVITDNRYSQTKLADEVKMSRTSMNLKLNNHANFTQNEIYRMTKVLKIPDAEVANIFFTPFVQKTVQNK